MNLEKEEKMTRGKTSNATKTQICGSTDVQENSLSDSKRSSQS